VPKKTKSKRLKQSKGIQTKPKSASSHKVDKIMLSNIQRKRHKKPHISKAKFNEFDFVTKIHKLM
jgi:hypothetical protein